MAIEYGTVAIVPKGDWNVETQYEVANLVTKDGSSYLAHTRPPVGTLPTNMDYWQVSAQGGNKATADAPGVVKPDGKTTTVDKDGTMSVKTATQSAVGAVKGGAGVKVGADGSLDINTTFTQAAQLANIIAGEAIAQVLGKVSKAIATTMSLDQNALLKNMLTNIDANDQNKIPTSALVHTLVERIGMGTELTAGARLTEAINQFNGDLSGENISDLNYSGDIKFRSGYYTSDTSHAPDNSGGNVITAGNGNSRTSQFAMSMSGDAYTRRCYGSDWTNWSKFLTNSDFETGTVEADVSAGDCTITLRRSYPSGTSSVVNILNGKVFNNAIVSGNTLTVLGIKNPGEGWYNGKEYVRYLICVEK